jgi:hypothetical protein
LIPLVDLGVIRGWRTGILCCRQHRSYGQQAHEYGHAENDSEDIFHLSPLPVGAMTTNNRTPDPDHRL